MNFFMLIGAIFNLISVILAALGRKHPGEPFVIENGDHYFTWRDATAAAAFFAGLGTILLAGGIVTWLV